MSEKSGFTLTEIMIVVSIIGVLATFALPAFIRARNDSQKNACINNLRQIDGAREQAALAYGWTTGKNVNGDPEKGLVNEYLKGSTTPLCPAGGTYDYSGLGTNPVCSQVSGGHVLPN